MSFMMFPPEVNSALMYAGAGSGPLMAAASAWDELAAELETTATSYQAVVQQLTGGPWLGPSSVQMTSATAPYIAWLQGSSLQAAQTSAQARLAAAAYEGAFDATVPPTVIAANRALLRRSGRVVWLTADVDTLWQRLQGDAATAERRPALTVGGREEVAEVLRVRESLYRDCADLAVYTGGRSPADVAAEVLASVSSQ